MNWRKGNKPCKLKCWGRDVCNGDTTCPRYVKRYLTNRTPKIKESTKTILQQTANRQEEPAQICPKCKSAVITIKCECENCHYK